MAHLTRAEATRKLPIERKGTKYIARALSNYNDSLPVIIAMRDMLGLAKTLREVKFMIKEGKLKLNGRAVRDYRESIKLMNIFEAGDQKFRLLLLPTGRFFLEDIKDSSRLCKVINKTAFGKGKVQINLHDGTNVMGDIKAKVGDSLEIDFSGKVKQVLPYEAGKKVFIYSGKSLGQYGAIETILDNKKAKIKLENRTVELNKNHFMIVR